MAHPYASHKSLHTDRIARITKGYARGGDARGEAKVRNLLGKAKQAFERHEATEMHGKPGKFARGGRTGKKGTHVNVIVAPHGPQGAPMPVQPPAIAPVAGGAPPIRPPMPPMGGPPIPGAMPPGGMPPGGPVPPMPMRKSGGRIKDGPTWREGLRNGTQVKNSPGKNDLKDIGRKPVITKKSGGRIGDFSEKRKMVTLDHAAGGGLGRLEKITKQRRVYP